MAALKCYTFLEFFYYVEFFYQIEILGRRQTVVLHILIVSTILDSSVDLGLSYVFFINKQPGASLMLTCMLQV